MLALCGQKCVSFWKVWVRMLLKMLCCTALSHNREHPPKQFSRGKQPLNCRLIGLRVLEISFLDVCDRGAK